MKEQSITNFNKRVEFSRRTFVASVPAAAVGSLAFGQSSALSAIVRADISKLPPYGNATLPTGIRSRIVENVNGLTMHVLEAGFEPKGRPCVLLLHGFPELAYSWRKVMLPLAEAGYYVVAPDQRGFGRTTGWDDAYDGDVDSFRRFNLVRDALGLISALGYRSVAAVVGHDHGAPNAAYCALLRPDVFRSVVLMAVAFGGPPQLPFDTADRPQTRSSSAFDDLANLRPAKKFYQDYYRTREAADNMNNPPQGLRNFLRAYYHCKSADRKENKPFELAAFTAAELVKIPSYYIMDIDSSISETIAAYMPSQAEIAACQWLTEPEIDVYAGEFKRTGFQGALNWYRIGAGKYASELEILSGRTIDIPACLIAGATDWVPYFRPGTLERMQKSACTQWRGAHFIEGAGHWVQQEKPDEVSRIIVQFLR
jgi:pimeloyl-ACP methyl ester carboxylesterase